MNGYSKVFFKVYFSSQCPAVLACSWSFRCNGVGVTVEYNRIRLILIFLDGPLSWSAHHSGAHEISPSFWVGFVLLCVYVVSFVHFLAFFFHFAMIYFIVKKDVAALESLNFFTRKISSCYGSFLYLQT